MIETRSVLEMLESVHDHMTVFELPEPYSVYVCGIAGEGQEHVSVHLRSGHGLTEMASLLVVWADTLAAVSVGVWYPRDGYSVHLEVDGKLTDGTTVRVWGGAPTDAADYPLEPGQRVGLTFGVLREWAEVRA